MKISRRKFLASSLAASAGILVGGYTIRRMRGDVPSLTSPDTSTVFLVNASDREEAIKKLVGEFDLTGFKDARVAFKANYNSDDPFPASTHIETLRAIVDVLNTSGAAEITLAERSGIGNTRRVLGKTGVFKLANQLGFKVAVLDELGGEDWSEIDAKGLHWVRGFKIAKIFVQADRVVQTCCLKTHRFGGHITMSLKNSVGVVAKRLPSGLYDYMAELHASPFQRLMIAEINRFYNVNLVIMDATEGFVEGGPERGKLVKPNLVLASKDRVAIDAVGVALLRSYGSTPEVMKGRIFDLEQISRAAELGVGAKSPSSIRLVSLDGESESVAEKLREILNTQG